MDGHYDTSYQVRQAIEGGLESIEWVVAHFHPLIERQIRLRLKALNPEDDEVTELASDVWMVALQKLRDLRPRDGRYTPVLVKFLATTAVFHCNNYMRRRIRALSRGEENKKLDVPSTMDRLAIDTKDVVSRIIDNEILNQVAAGLCRLTPDKEEVLVLRLVEQRSNAEIAEMLGLSANTVAKRYRRALESLRRNLPRSVFDHIWSATGRSEDCPSDG